MSVRVMSEVFARYPSGGGEMLLALALADVSRDDGLLMINDTVPELARKTRQTERGVQKQLQRMVASGWLALVRGSDGGRGRSSVYRISREWIAGADLVAVPGVAASDETPNAATQNPERGSGYAHTETPNAATQNPERGSGAYRPRRPNTENPPYPPRGASGPSSESRSTKAACSVRLPSQPVTLGAWLERCKALGEKPIPPDDPVFAYAAEVGIGDEVLALHWWQFKRVRRQGAKRQRNWRQTFRNSVEGNWFRLWFIKPGMAADLTTQGLQAQAMRSAELRQAGGAAGDTADGGSGGGA